MMSLKYLSVNGDVNVGTVVSKLFPSFDSDADLFATVNLTFHVINDGIRFGLH